jgi:hypothetical protein
MKYDIDELERQVDRVLATDANPSHRRDLKDVVERWIEEEAGRGARSPAIVRLLALRARFTEAEGQPT